MKKLLLVFLTALTFGSAFAENNVYVKPFTIDAANATSGSSGYFYICVNNDIDVYTMSFDLYLPDGFNIYTNASGKLITSSLVLDNTDGRTSYYDEDEEDNVAPFSAASGFNNTVDSDGNPIFRFGGAGAYKLGGTSGIVFKARYKLSKDLEPGVYPIKIVGGLRDGASQGPDPVATSYFVVSGATGASLTYTGEVPTQIAEALNEETAISYLDVSKATAINGTLKPNDMLVAGAASSSYKRSVGDGNYATVCLPMVVKGTYYTVDKVTSTSITLKEATDLPENTPAIVKGDISASADSYVTLGTPVAGDNGLTGTYEALADFDCCYISGSKFHNDHASVKPYRAYLPTIASGSKVLSVYLEDATGIHEITDQLSDEDIYTLQGIRVNKAQKGINIIGGKKIYNK